MAKNRARRGYEVLGEFKRLPDFTERAVCESCAVTPIALRKRVKKEVLAEYLLPAETQLALSLGRRVATYLALVSSGDRASTERAFRLHREMKTALLSWREQLPNSPRKDKALGMLAQTYPDITSLLSAFTEDGNLISLLESPPKYEAKYQGTVSDVLGQALFLFRSERVVSLASLASFRRTLGASDDPEQLRAALISGRWCVDGTEWLPESEYYSGALWLRYDRAIAAADKGDAVAAAQAARLLELIAPVTLSVIEPDPRLAWIPTSVLRAWLASFLQEEIPELERRYEYLMPKDISVAALVSEKEGKSSQLGIAIGFLNNDHGLFVFPKALRQIDAQTGGEESYASAQARARTAFEEQAVADFRSFLRENRADAALVEEAYNRKFRGYIEPTYTEFGMPARWGKRITLREHQQAGAARLLAHMGGLLAFDVGVGKTYTGIATIAKLREEGRARRPVVVVPNSLLFQWLKQFQVALPDYRVLVIGAERYIGRSGALVSRTDTAEERAQKWRQFQAGGADVVIVSYSMFARATVRYESRKDFALHSPPMLRTLGLRMRSDLSDVTSDKKEQKKKPAKASKKAVERMFGVDKVGGMTKEELEAAGAQVALEQERQRESERQKLKALIANLSSIPERERALLDNRIRMWAVSKEGEEGDPGIFWEDLGIDCLVLDEAQNMKNLWPAPQGNTEKPPKYLGAIAEPTDRALEFAIRAYLVRKLNGGSGVFLLSATPAKNSPLEYFSLLSLVDGEAWSRVGISDPEQFMNRYLRLEIRYVLGTGGQNEQRAVVAGFRNIPELKDLLFRYAEFRTAEEVGLKLPKTEPKTIAVPMEEKQAELHGEMLQEYRTLMKSFSGSAAMKALGILMRLSLLSIHPALPFGPEDKEGKREWNAGNWRRVERFASPKLLRCAEEILKRRACGHIAFCEPIGAQYWLRELLVEKGIPRERIAILNADEADTPLKRQVIAEKFNGTAAILDESGNIEQEGVPPEYDVVIANSVAYEGIDLHIRTCMVYHLDLPWEPATLQQRNGRAVRQGNTQAVIGIYYLISQGSIDAVRLSIILGKLAWMKDILQSAERETNNPAAGSEMDRDELVTFLYSPTQLAEVREELAKRKEAEDRRNARRRAWGIVRRLQEMVESYRERSSIEQGEQNHAVRELLRQLDEIPPSSWPWRRVVVKEVLDGHKVALIELPNRAFSAASPTDKELNMTTRLDPTVTVPLWDGVYFASGADDGSAVPVRFQVGEVSGDAASLRLYGRMEWERITGKVLSAPKRELHRQLAHALSQARPENYDGKGWDKLLDREGRESGLRALMDRIPEKGLAALSMKYAPDFWRVMIWEQWGRQILQRMGVRRLPVDRGSLLFLPATQALGLADAVLPWTQAGFERFVNRAKESSYKWTELNTIAESWFERPFPKGVLSRDESEIKITLQFKRGPVEIVARWLRGGLTVHRRVSPDGTPLEDGGWGVSHVASGLSVIERALPTSAHAQRLAEWLLTIEVDWTKEHPSLPTDISGESVDKIARWVSEQVLAPPVEQIAEHYAADRK